MRATLAATFHLTRWYAIELWFLFNIDYNFKLIPATLLLSFKKLASPSICIPNILNLNLRPIIYFTYVFSAINLLEKVPDTAVACHLLYQVIGAQLANMMYQVCDHLIFLSSVWDASTKVLTWTNLPLGLGASLGTYSFPPLYLSRNILAVIPVNDVRSIMARFGLKYNVNFGFLFKKSKIRDTWCKRPSWGASWY